MEQRISLVTLGVSDLLRARTFYETLGWSGAQQPDDEVCFFQAGGMVFGLWTALGGHGAPGIELAHNVRSPEEVTEVLNEAQRAGGSIVRRAAVADWGGTTGTFADPDGSSGRWRTIRAGPSSPTVASKSRGASSARYHSRPVLEVTRPAESWVRVLGHIAGQAVRMNDICPPIAGALGDVETERLILRRFDPDVLDELALVFKKARGLGVPIRARDDSR